jgi:spermidine synthase
MTSSPSTSEQGVSTPAAWPLYVTVFLIATAGLVYELIAGAVASYVLGDSVTQFSLVIGLYLSALGVGAYISKFIDQGIAKRFVDIELATALVGGTSAPLLLFAFGHAGSFRLILYGIVSLTGILVGLELPLLMRLLSGRVELKDLVAKALLFDYLGALVASVLFALLLVPNLGLIRTSLVFGLVNAIVGLGSTWLLPVLDSKELNGARVRAVIVSVVLIAGLTQADRLMHAVEIALYSDPILYAKETPYQRIIVTKNPKGFALYLNNNLQFASLDERRYHEALVHPAFSALGPDHKAKQVLIAGGGDGLAAREVLKYPELVNYTLIDLDPAMTNMSKTLDEISRLNQGSLVHAKGKVINADAMSYLQSHPELKYDIMIIDFPDPNRLSLGKLFSTSFYRIATKHLEPDGVMVVQSTSPLYSRHSYWCVAHTIQSAGFYIHPYHAFVPAFGEWGYVLAKRTPFPIPTDVRVSGLSYLNSERMRRLFVFPPDMAEVTGPINRLDTQALVTMYDREIGRFLE